MKMISVRRMPRDPPASRRVNENASMRGEANDTSRSDGGGGPRGEGQGRVWGCPSRRSPRATIWLSPKARARTPSAPRAPSTQSSASAAENRLPFERIWPGSWWRSAARRTATSAVVASSDQTPRKTAASRRTMGESERRTATSRPTPRASQLATGMRMIQTDGLAMFPPQGLQVQPALEFVLLRRLHLLDLFVQVDDSRGTEHVDHPFKQLGQVLPFEVGGTVDVAAAAAAPFSAATHETLAEEAAQDGGHRRIGDPGALPLPGAPDLARGSLPQGGQRVKYLRLQFAERRVAHRGILVGRCLINPSPARNRRVRTNTFRADRTPPGSPGRKGLGTVGVGPIWSIGPRLRRACWIWSAGLLSSPSGRWPGASRTGCWSSSNS